jgi:hypothetical protein
MSTAEAAAAVRGVIAETAVVSVFYVSGVQLPFRGEFRYSGRMGSEARDGLIASVALMQTAAAGGFRPSLEAADRAWEKAEEYVAALELFPQNTAECPCCTKQVALCVKHYQLHAPGKLCSACVAADEVR